MLKQQTPPQTWMQEAFKLARKSPDPSTQNGAVIVHNQHGIVAEGFNEFPAGVHYTDERWDRPAKYDFIEHAERNAIYEAARYGVAIEGTTMYLVGGPPCTDCARAVIQAGIDKLVYYEHSPGAHWDQSLDTATTILVEAGIYLVPLLLPMPESTEPVLRAGELWLPFQQ